MSFMKPEILKKGALYSADCDKCGMTLFTHEWVHDDHNERRDAMENGTCRCDECSGRADPDTFMKCKDSYAGRYSAPGYLDCTPWEYDSNLRRLISELNAMYGEELERDNQGRFVAR